MQGSAAEERARAWEQLLPARPEGSQRLLTPSAEAKMPPSCRHCRDYRRNRKASGGRRRAAQKQRRPERRQPSARAEARKMRDCRADATQRNATHALLTQPYANAWFLVTEQVTSKQ